MCKHVALPGTGLETPLVVSVVQGGLKGSGEMGLPHTDEDFPGYGVGSRSHNGPDVPVHK
jgi:hypothetical protein